MARRISRSSRSGRCGCWTAVAARKRPQNEAQRPRWDTSSASPRTRCGDGRNRPAATRAQRTGPRARISRSYAGAPRGQEAQTNQRDPQDRVGAFRRRARPAHDCHRSPVTSQIQCELDVSGERYVHQVSIMRGEPSIAGLEL